MLRESAALLIKQEFKLTWRPYEKLARQHCETPENS